MNVMRRFKSIASTCSTAGGYSGTKRAKVNQEVEGEVAAKSSEVEHQVMATKQNASSKHVNSNASSSNSGTLNGNEKADVDQLPKEL